MFCTHCPFSLRFCLLSGVLKNDERSMSFSVDMYISANQCRLVQSGNVPVSMTEHIAGVGTLTFKYAKDVNREPVFNGVVFKTVTLFAQ